MLRLAKDNIPILIHDDTLDRTTTGSGLVCDFTFDEIKKLDAGYFFISQKHNYKSTKSARRY